MFMQSGKKKMTEFCVHRFERHVHGCTSKDCFFATINFVNLLIKDCDKKQQKQGSVVWIMNREAKKRK